MSLRFYRRVRIAPGRRVNLSTSGAGLKTYISCLDMGRWGYMTVDERLTQPAIRNAAVGVFLTLAFCGVAIFRGSWLPR
jgi:hypothetical protein